MKTQKQILSAVVAGAVLASVSASAVSFGDGGAALQAVLNGLTVAPTPGVSSVDVTTGSIAEGSDAHWAIGGSGGSANTLAYNLGAAFAPFNVFGIYDVTDPSKQVRIFTGGAAGDTALISILANGSVIKNLVDTTIDFAGNSFGYFLTTPEDNTFYSDTSLNGDSTDHMLAFKGQGTDTIQIGPLSPGIWGPSEYLLAWEDLYNGGDADYEDLAVMVESVNPRGVPDGGSTMILLAAGFLGMAALRRRVA